MRILEPTGLAFIVAPESDLASRRGMLAETPYSSLIVTNLLLLLCTCTYFAYLSPTCIIHEDESLDGRRVYRVHILDASIIKYRLDAFIDLS